MAIATYEPLATITVSSTDAEIVFGSIPQRFRDLVLVADQKNMSGSGILATQFNGDTSTSYITIAMYSEGSTRAAEFGTRTFIKTSVSNVTSNEILIMQFLDYSTTDRHKVCLIRSGEPAANLQAAGGRWAGTNAITSISLFHNAGTNRWGAGTTFSLYGIAG